MPVTLQIGAPLTWAGSVIGEERMMNWLIKKPELVHIVLDKVTEFVIKVAEYYVKEFGAEKLMAFHGAATETNKLISPKQFETFSLPYLQTHQRPGAWRWASAPSSSTSAASRTRTSSSGSRCP